MNVHRSGTADTSERGASLVEYTLLVALIAIVCIGAAAAFGVGINDSVGDSNNELYGSTSAG